MFTGTRASSHHSPTNYRTSDYFPDHESDETLGGRRVAETEVWPTYNREARAFDGEIMDQWNTDMDVIVIAVGLFSAVLTGFIVEASYELQQNYTELSYRAVIQLAQIMRASAMNEVIPALVLEDSTFEPSVFAKAVNGLLYCSLGCALIAGVFALVIKIWIREYRDIPKTNPYDEALRRQFRFDGIQHWKMIAFVRFASQTFGFSLLLGSAGCLTRASYIHWTSALALAVPFGAAIITYYTTIVIGLMHPECPYKAPISTNILRVRYLWDYFWRGRDHTDGLPQDFRQRGHGWFEQAGMEKRGLKLDIAALSWLVQSTSSRVTVQEAVSWACKLPSEKITVAEHILDDICNVISSEPSKATYAIEPIINLLEDKRSESLLIKVKDLLLKMAKRPPLDVRVLRAVLDRLCLLIPDRPTIYILETMPPNVDISKITTKLIESFYPLLEQSDPGTSVDVSRISRTDVSGLIAIMDLAVASTHDASYFNVAACLIFRFLPYAASMAGDQRAKDEMDLKLRNQFLTSLKRWLSVNDHSQTAPQIYQQCSQMILHVRISQPEIEPLDALEYGITKRVQVTAGKWDEEDDVFQELRNLGGLDRGPKVFFTEDPKQLNPMEYSLRRSVHSRRSSGAPGRSGST